MRFSAVFEFHKIPEWYDQYFPYTAFVKGIEQYLNRCKDKGINKQPGIYYLAMGEGKSDTNENPVFLVDEDVDPDVLLVPIPIFVDGFEDVCEALKGWIAEVKKERAMSNQLSMIAESDNESDIDATTKETEKWR